MIELPPCHVVYVDNTQPKSTIFVPGLGWVNDPATIGQYLSALSATGPALLEWRSTPVLGSSNGDMEPKKNS